MSSRVKRRAAGIAATIAAVSAPVVASAGSLIALAQTIQRTVYRPMVTAILAYALLLFIWGVYRYIASAGDEKASAEGSKLMSYGILVLFVMVSVWGLVSIMMNAIGVPTGGGRVQTMEGYDYDTSNPFYGNVV
jgi:TRAP-type C4-dicarboxylate transport system permease small subunit